MAIGENFNNLVQYQYLVVLTPAEEGGYTVTVPALPGCISEGDSKQESLANIKDAISGYLVTARKHQIPIFSGIQEIAQVEVAAGFAELNA